MSDKQTIEDVERMLVAAWGNLQPAVLPSLIYMTMDGVRKAPWTDDDQEVKTFIAAHTHVPDEAIIQLTSEGIAIWETEEQIATFNAGLKVLNEAKYK